MSYEVQDGQIVERVEVEKVLRIQNGQTFMVDETIYPEDFEGELVRVRPAFAIPFLADGG